MITVYKSKFFWDVDLKPIETSLSKWGRHSMLQPYNYFEEILPVVLSAENE